MGKANEGTDAAKRAKARYRKKCKRYQFEVYPTERDIMERLDSVQNRAGYIKALVRADIEKNS